MPDGFSDLLDRAQVFYGQLAQNNSKDWFEPRKADWKADIEAPAKLFADILAEDLSHLTSTPHLPKVFRIYRDVRFSKDKAPYKTMLAMLWRPGDQNARAPSFYFGIEPDRTFAGCGLPELDKGDLGRFRAMIDQDGELFQDVVTASGAQLADIGPQPLKRVPKPFAPDHPYSELLKRKSVVIGMPLADDWKANGTGLVSAVMDRFRAMLPFRQIMMDWL